MALSKSTRIIILLVIDSAFFLLELITGYAVHSLALVADSFHMLNDVLSLCVGLWAVKVAHRKTTEDQLKTYTYGWQRAETLGALVNGVFLVALCVTIFLDAIQRFVEPQVVSNPQLVLVVGCLGLASNLIGLALFHEHSHGHGHGSHGHEHAHHDGARNAEEGCAGAVTTTSASGGHARENSQVEDSASTAVEDCGSLGQKTSNTRQSNGHRYSRSKSRTYSSIDDIHVNPNAFRRSIIDASITRLDPMQYSDDGSAEGQAAPECIANDDADDTHAHSSEPLLKSSTANEYGSVTPIDHKQHRHAQPKTSARGHGHSHGDLNMRGIFLHVMGDALGNIGVISTALIIWLTDVPWRFYFDPAISLVITCIILTSAIPLCKAASRILLQAVPAGISVDDIRADIEDLPGIISCHHLHVWQLSDTKLIASLHVQLAFDFNNDGSGRYMRLAQAIHKCLHEYNIHSSTIQPEFCLDPKHNHAPGAEDDGESSGSTHVNDRIASKPGSLREADPCLLESCDDCDGDQSCCDQQKLLVQGNAQEHRTS